MSSTALGNIAQNVAVIATIDPDAYATGAQTTDVIDMRYWREVAFIVMAGDLGSSATLDFVVKGDTASNGSFATTITGKSITQLTEAGTDSDKQVVVRVSAEEAAAQGYRYLRGTMTVGTATSDCAVLVVGTHMRYHPASGFDLASVDEIVL